MPTTMDELHGEQLAQQLRDLERRLVHDHENLSAKAVHECVERERARFANARIFGFIPVLVERAVRPKLRHL
jgi:hypothetical protein